MHVPRRRKKRDCVVEVPVGCGDQSAAGTASVKDQPSLFRVVNRILTVQGAVASLRERRLFVEIFERANRQREVVGKRSSKIASGSDDIIALIHAARSSGDMNEAIWRCFIAAHFGRTSARADRQIQSALRFLCAFRKSPFWTWERVVKNPEALHEWLLKCADDLDTLMYGNHRKYESQKPKYIWSVIESFVLLANAYGSPTDLISNDVDDEDDGFDFLYRRLRPVKRFGRTGRFDFLVLLLDLGFITAEPRRPYLRRSTGPLAGAKLLWGEQSPNTLDDFAADLSEQLGISPIVLEDALCNWQK